MVLKVRHGLKTGSTHRGSEPSGQTSHISGRQATWQVKAGFLEEVSTIHILNENVLGNRD